MPPLEPMSSSHDASIVSGEPNNPVCPSCQRAMTVKEVMPLSAIGVGGAIYVCDVCGTETHRTAKRR
jgi:ribosomal protein L37AE/L43A